MVKENTERDFPAMKKNDLCLFSLQCCLIKKSNALVAIDWRSK